MRAGRFRSDLFFRLATATVTLPPLRERRAEIALLAQRFLTEAGAHVDRSPMTLSPAILAELTSYAWPGNVRELKNLMDYLAATVAAYNCVSAIPPKVLGFARGDSRRWRRSL